MNLKQTKADLQFANEEKLELLTTIVERFETHGILYLDTLKQVLKDKKYNK